MLTSERAEIAGLRDVIRKLEHDARLAEDDADDWKSQALGLIAARRDDAILIANLRTELADVRAVLATARALR